ncbi:BMP and activin membrane-bound inhibitor like protein [Dufourea novaeangliae]|uniref:BMP and activin membrane-bound inhibitor like protein n=1 Tax=Dufourea novaeangliae TaxID=178035 RepID=A0A154PF02_DUFNO|nr:BMP and activin membrane-bound inhibitor like protein [Dufourea novaeangliae]
MLSRDLLLTFATMVSSLSAAVVVGASVDLDSGDYEVLADNEGKSDDNGNVTFSAHDFMGKSGDPSGCSFRVRFIIRRVNRVTPEAWFQFNDSEGSTGPWNEDPSRTETTSIPIIRGQSFAQQVERPAAVEVVRKLAKRLDKLLPLYHQFVLHSPNVREVRCYCNQPECVPQGYMCRGRGCFTELPSNTNPSLLRAEHNAYSGCLDESFKERQCPTGYLCCEQDLCNHVDSPAMRNRLNKTLQVLVGDQRPFLGPLQPINHGGQSTDGWFKTATIAVPICGLIVLLILASLAIRLLQPVPTQNDKLGPHRMPDNGPPLLGPPKVPLV